MNRRRLLQGGAVGLGGGIAGCITQNDGGDGDRDHDHNHDHDHDHDHDADSAGSSSENGIDPALQLNGTGLSDAFPIELVESDIEPFEGYATPEQRVANVHWHGEDLSHWHFQPVELPVDGRRRVRTRFVDRNDREIPIGPDETYFQSVRTTGETTEGSVSIAVNGAYVTFFGEATGIARVVFRLHDVDDETVRWTSPELELRVVG